VFVVKWFGFPHLAVCLAIFMASVMLVEAAKSPNSPDAVKIKPDIGSRTQITE
jgi:hypothetical protein